MELDEVLQKIGEFGLYQRRVYFPLCLVATAAAMHSMGYVFWGARPLHWCETPDTPSLDNESKEILSNISSPWIENGKTWVRSSCQLYDIDYKSLNNETLELLQRNLSSLPRYSCDRWEYDQSQYTSTIVTKWDLVCQYSLLLSASQSVYMAGRILGTLIFGHLGDILGRRLTLIITTILSLVLSVGSAIAPEFYSFCVLRFLLAAAEAGQFIVAFTIVVEIVGTKWRVFTGSMLMIFWALGYLVIALLAYLLRDVLHLQLALSVPTALLCTYYWLVPESPRWLLVQGRRQEATRLIQKMARVNGADLPDDINITVVKEAKHNSTFIDLIRTHSIRKNTVILCFIWMVNSVVYYGLSLNTSNLGGNDYINFGIAGVVEIPAYLLNYFALEKLGRRLPQAIAMVTAGLALLATVPIPQDLHVVKMLFAMIGKFAITSSFGMIFIYTSELYPTVVRTIGLGTCNIMSKVASTLGPFTADLDSVLPGLSLAVFGITSLVAGLLVFLLPETRDQPLPATIAEAEALNRQQHALCCKKSSRKKHAQSQAGDNQASNGDCPHSQSKLMHDSTSTHHDVCP